MATGTPVGVTRPNAAIGRLLVVVVEPGFVDVVDAMTGVVTVAMLDVVGPGDVTDPPQETTIARSSVIDPRTLARYWQATYCVSMFGPLNGVRVALVAAAGAAALAAFFAGFTAAGVVLLAGVVIHGAGWLYLYSQRDSNASD